MIPSTHPGQPHIISYATQLGFLILSFAFTLEATDGNVSTCPLLHEISPVL